MLGLGRFRKYQFMEQNLQRRVVGLKDKLPDISKTLDTVRFLKLRTVGQGTISSGCSLVLTGGTRQAESDPIETTFELNDTLLRRPRYRLPMRFTCGLG